MTRSAGTPAGLADAPEARRARFRRHPRYHRVVFGLLRRRKAAPTPPAAKTWREAELFRGLSEAQLGLIEPHVSNRELARGETLVQEGELATDLFVVDSGRLEVVTHDTEAGRELVVGEIGPDQVVGEVALFDALPRSATVRAIEPCKVWVVGFHELRPSHGLIARSSMDPRPKPIRSAYHKLLENLAGMLADRLRTQTNRLREGAKQREATGHFLVNILILICAYTFLLSGLVQLGERAPANTSLVSIPVQVVFALGSWRFIRSTGYPLSEFGLSLRHLIGSLFEAALFTLPALALVTGIKWVLQMTIGHPDTVPLIAYPDVAARLDDRQVLIWLSVYSVASAVQELIVRGALQSSLEMFLTGRQRVLKAIVISALIFAMMHLHMSFLFAALAFLPGLFWGWLFSRKKNLAGVTLSHVVVGGYVFFIMGVAF